MTVKIPKAYKFLFEPARFKVCRSGRGAAKSWSFARALLIQGAQNKLLVVCAREIQASIKESVHRLLVNQIQELGLQEFYTHTNEVIRGANGTEFIFKGLWQNVDNIKSLEGADRVWIEEGNLTTKQTWEKLEPTVRKDGSEIWVSYNTELEDDFIHQHFVMQDPPPKSIVVKTSWRDNPYFPQVLRDSMEAMKERDYQNYLHVWEGEPKQAIDGAIFASELELAATENRITSIKPKAGVPVQTFWDLGQSDQTSIWFVQLIGMEYWLLDYYSNNGQKMPHYIDILAKKGYMYGTHCLPHDAEHEQLAANKTIKQQLMDALRDNGKLGINVRVVPRIAQKALGINAARDIFPQCIFDAEKTKEGRKCLSRYHYERDEQTGRVSKNPAHDIWSHGADAFLCLAQHAKKPVSDSKKKYIRPNTKWMR